MQFLHATKRRLLLATALVLAVITAPLVTPLLAQDGESPHWISTVWPILAIAVPTVISAVFQKLKKGWLSFLDRLPAFAQQVVVGSGTVVLTTLAAHFGADLTGVAPASPEGLTLIVLSVFATFGNYNAVIQPTSARKSGA